MLSAPGATPGGRHVLSWRNPNHVVPSPAWWMTDVEEQRRLRSNVRMRRHRNRSSDNVRALRSQADRERKRTARQQATESRRSQHVSARGLICACVYLVKLKWLLKVSLLWQTQRVHKSPQRTQCPWKMPSENPGRHRYTCTVIDLGLSWYSREILFLQRYYYTQVIFRKLKKNTDLPEDYQSVITKYNLPTILWKV